MKMLSRQKVMGSLGGNAIETVMGFLVIMFVTRNYPQSQVGVYFLVLAIISILNNLKEGFLQNGFVKYMVEQRFSKEVLRTGFAIALLGEGIKLVAFFAITLFFDELRSFAPAFACYSLTFSTYRLLVFIHKSRLAVHQIVRGNLLLLMSALLGMLFLYWYNLRIEAVFWVLCFGHLFTIVGIRANREIVLYNLFRSYNRELLLKMARFGKYGFFKEIAGSIAHQAGLFVSVYFLTLEATSVLGLATRYTILISIPGASLAGLLYPIILKKAGNPKALKITAIDGIGKMYAMLIPLAFLLMSVAPFLIYFLHGIQYLSAIYILGFKILASVFLIPLGSGYSSLMNAINKPQEITKLMLISSGSNILLSIVLIYLLGLRGAAIAPLLAEVIGGYIMSLRLRKHFNLEVFQIAHTTRNYWNYWITKYKTLPWKRLRFQS